MFKKVRDAEHPCVSKTKIPESKMMITTGPIDRNTTAWVATVIQKPMAIMLVARATTLVEEVIAVRVEKHNTPPH